MLLKKQKVILFSIQKVKYTKTNKKYIYVNPLFCNCNFYLTKKAIFEISEKVEASLGSFCQMFYEICTV